MWMSLQLFIPVRILIKNECLSGTPGLDIRPCLYFVPWFLLCFSSSNHIYLKFPIFQLSKHCRTSFPSISNKKSEIPIYIIHSSLSTFDVGLIRIYHRLLLLLSYIVGSEPLSWVHMFQWTKCESGDGHEEKRRQRKCKREEQRFPKTFFSNLKDQRFPSSPMVPILIADEWLCEIYLETSSCKTTFA